MKRILVQTGLGANYYIRQSLVNAWRAVGYEVYFWDDSGKSPFDVFTEFNPDIFLGSTWQLNRALVKCINNKPELKTILYGDIWEPINSIDIEQYPVGIATDEQKKFVDQLYNIPYIISNHGPKYVEATHGGWRNLGCKPESVLVSADITQYKVYKKDLNYETQIVYTGGIWGFKSRNLDKYISPLLYPTTKWKIRIFGNGWNSVNALGGCSDVEIAKHYSNSMVIPHVVEPHCSELWQDLPLRYMQVPACKGFAISCPCVGVRDVFSEDELLVANDPSHFMDLVVHYLNNQEETIYFRENAFKKVMNNHTGFHRCKQIFDLISEDTTRIQAMIDSIEIKDV